MLRSVCADLSVSPHLRIRNDCGCTQVRVRDVKADELTSRGGHGVMVSWCHGVMVLRGQRFGHRGLDAVSGVTSFGDHVFRCRSSRYCLEMRSLYSCHVTG